MGDPYSCIDNSFFKLSDVVAIIGILVNSGLAIWIVRTIQNRLTNKRALKDHLICEVKDIRNEYRNYLNNLYLNKIYPKTVTPWFKLMNIKVNDLMEIIHSKYKIDKKKLIPFQIDLRELITNKDEFENQYREDKPLIFSEESRIQFIAFQQNNNQVFNQIIIQINDFES